MATWGAGGALVQYMGPMVSGVWKDIKRGWWGGVLQICEVGDGSRIRF